MATEQGEIDYLVLVDISYGETCQRAFPVEWAGLLAEVDRRFLDVGFSPEGLLFYRTHTAGHPEKLGRVHNVLFELRDFLNSLDWMLEFNIILALGDPGDFGAMDTMYKLAACVPGVNQIWRLQEDQPMFDQLSTSVYERFYSVHDWRSQLEGKMRDHLMAKAEHRQLLEAMRACLMAGDSCVLIGPDFAGKSFFVDSMLREMPGSSPVVLRACSNSQEPQTIFQPLLDYCFGKNLPWDGRSRALLNQARQQETLTYQQLHRDLPELLPPLREFSCLIVCEQLECWPDSARTVLHTLVKEKNGIPFLLVSSEQQAVERALLRTFFYPPPGWRGENDGKQLPENLTPRMLDVVGQDGPDWQRGEDFPDFVLRLLSESEQRAWMLLSEANGLLTRWDVLQIESASQPALEKLVARGLVRENKSLFVCLPGKLSMEKQACESLRKSVAAHWLKGNLTIDRGARLSCWGELPAEKR